jgi:putative molybdopterin biosynthesis protein
LLKDLEMIDENALTAQDVAERLNIAKNTVYELVKRKELNFYKVGRKMRFTLADLESYIEGSRSGFATREPEPRESRPAKVSEGGFIISGQDSILDVLASRLEKIQGLDRQPLRSYVGSYKGLSALYNCEVHAATSHLWDGDSGSYNLPFVRRLLPGISCVLVHLTMRTQGFYVAEGNPKGISDWSDLFRDDIVLVNREKGAGSRVLLDERLRILGIPGRMVKGYAREEANHLSVAGAVGRGEADFGLGDMKAASQVEGVDFIPLQKEDYALVLKKEDMPSSIVKAIMDILSSREFREQFGHMKGYDISDIGKIVGET